jgi:hypothetical protein
MDCGVSKTWTWRFLPAPSAQEKTGRESRPVSTEMFSLVSASWCSRRHACRSVLRRRGALFLGARGFCRRGRGVGIVFVFRDDGKAIFAYVRRCRIRRRADIEVYTRIGIVKPICRRWHDKRRCRNEQQRENQFRFHRALQIQPLGPGAPYEDRPINYQIPETAGAQGKAVSFLKKILSGWGGIICPCGAATRHRRYFSDRDKDATVLRHRAACGNRPSVRCR